MKLKEIITQRHSKQNTAAAVKLLVENKKFVGELISYLSGDDKQLARRAAWVASELTRTNPGLIQPFVKKITANLIKKNADDAVKRNTLRVFQWLAMPKPVHGLMMNLCFDIIVSNDEQPAVKANALSILEILYETYPGIGSELVSIIESRYDNESPAFKTRASKLLKKMKNL
ncbi:MAG: hypothetical protein EOO04_17575 [Chitinophagaceae bacterium]|nr:MAG: hypothetical protein EOO04_17575 [Chitinophagaceae bacterium]